jgi:hypothetical protein
MVLSLRNEKDNLSLSCSTNAKNTYNFGQKTTAASMMFRIVFWDVLLCKIIVDPDDGGSTYL